MRGKLTFFATLIFHYKTRGKQSQTLKYTIIYEKIKWIHVVLFLNCLGIEKHSKTRMNHSCRDVDDFHVFVTPAEIKELFCILEHISSRKCVLFG